MHKDAPSVVAMAGLFVVAQVIAVLLAPQFQRTTGPAFPNPTDPVNSVLYILLILAFTGVILLVIRLKREVAVKYIILAAMFFTMLLVFYVPLLVLLVEVIDPVAADLLSTALAGILSAVLTYALAKYPEWYLVDAVGISVAAGAIAVLGISFAILPALLLLIGLAIYDAISVYKTKHMVILADAVAGQRLPILLVMPKKRGYSFLQQKRLKRMVEKGEEREAMFMGLGDVIIPGILVVSAFVYLSGRSQGVLGIAGNVIVAAVTLAGTLVGYATLMRYVLKGNPQAGLPLLNSGAILGYLLSYYAVYRDLGFGILG